MKPHTINPILFFSLLLFFACEEPAEVRQMTEPGTITFKPEVTRPDPVYLTNARTGEQAKTHAEAWPIVVTIEQDGKVVKDKAEITEETKIKLDPGQYTAKLQSIDQRENYKGKVAAESDGMQKFTIEAGKSTVFDVLLLAKDIRINLTLEGMDETAMAWAGPEGFEPSDENRLIQDADNPKIFYTGETFYANENFEVIVEWNGEQKSFIAPNSAENYIKIINEPKEEEPKGEPEQDEDQKTGTLAFNYAIYAGDAQPITWYWNE